MIATSYSLFLITKGYAINDFDQVVRLGDATILHHAGTSTVAVSDTVVPSII